MTKYTLLSFECDALGRAVLQKNGYLPDGARNWVLYRKNPCVFSSLSRQLLDALVIACPFCISPVPVWLAENYKNFLV
jgi:hypothetical protein